MISGRPRSMLLALTGALLCVSHGHLAAQDLDWAAGQHLLAQYSWQSQGDRTSKGDLDLEGIHSEADLARHAVAMVQRLRGEEMPPQSAAQPSDSERSALVAWISRLGEPSMPDDPGTVVMPRLTPSRYERAVRDIAGIPIRVATMLPRDGGGGEGFDNVGDAQAITPMHLQAYLQAAHLVLEHAVIVPERPIDWRSVSLGDISTTHELEQVLMSDWNNWFHVEAQRLADQQFEDLRQHGLLPDTNAWQHSMVTYTQANLYYLIVYLHAAWQVRHRAELGHPSWTIADVAATYPVPLYPEILERVMHNLLQPFPRGIYLRRLIEHWEALPPPAHQ